MKLEIRDKHHAAILEKAFNSQEVIEFHGVSLAIKEFGYNFDGLSSWTFGFREVQNAKWNGEGLPPVGTVCQHEGRIDDREWLEVKVIAHTEKRGYEVAVFEYEDIVTYSTARYFRPIRTPEQIAAEEREKGITEMRRQWSLGGERDKFAALWDAGYRK